MINNNRVIKYVYVFGGVLSGLGKGIVASSLGYLLKSKGHSNSLLSTTKGSV